MDYEDNFEDIDYDMLYDDPYSEMEANYFTNHMGSYTLQNLFDDCLIPTISDGVTAVFNIFMCCLLLRFTSSLGFLPSSVIHLSSGALGVFCVHHLYSFDCIYVVIFGLVGYLSILILHKVNVKFLGPITAVIVFTFLIVCEVFVIELKVWHKVRGSQMVLAMKIISLAFDIDRQELPLPSPDQVFGYLFSVGTVTFGPWVSFATYCRMLKQHTKMISWALKTLQCTLLSFLFLTLSTCWSSWFLDFTNWKWLAAYRDALSFRSSHYFICFISESLAVASGISANSGSWELPVARPHMIEIPRSLVEVVICWNIPIHCWLKNYVFKSAKPLGNFAAVFLTYVVSSLLHGLNFQLAAVLLSLGIYTYIEHVLRKKLSSIFDACVLARKCKNDCSHKYKNLSPYVLITNTGFGLLAMFHLAYLGVMFDSSSSLQEEGYNMDHTLEKWSELEFASHYIALVTYIFYILI